MSANVETMMYVRETPWHGLGTKVDEAPTSADALRLAGLDWEIEGKPVFTEGGNIIPGYKANTRSSDGSVLGIVSNRYTIVQNAEAFAFTDSLLGEEMRYETAGSLRGGKQIWLLGRMPERHIAGDAVDPYICFTNTHDGTGAVRVCMTPVRVVCNNTLNMALSSAKRAWSTRHVGDIAGRLEDARQTLELADIYLSNLAEEAERLAGEKMTEGQMREVLDSIFPVTDDMSDRAKRTASETKDEIIVCTLAPDLVKFLNTKWCFINAVSDYVGHNDPHRRTKNFEENRWANIIGGHWLFDAAVAKVCG